MTVATYTSTTYINQPAKDVYTGVIAVDGVAKWTAAGTVGDILFLCKVPHGAKIVDFAEYHTNGETAAALDFGFDRGVAAGGGANASIVLSGGALATMNRFSLAGGPLQISLSDADPVRHAILIAKAASGTVTVTVVVNWSLRYRMDETQS